MAFFRDIWDKFSPLFDIYRGINIIMSIITCRDRSYVFIVFALVWSLFQ